MNLKSRPLASGSCRPSAWPRSFSASLVFPVTISVVNHWQLPPFPFVPLCSLWLILTGLLIPYDAHRSQDLAADLKEIEEFFHQQIPLTRAMALHVEAYDGAQLVLTAPLALNHNHLGTAFGGSLAAMGMVAGYGLVWLMLGKREGHVVVRDSSIHFRRPVRGILRAICRRPDEATVADFLRKFATERNAHLLLDVTIENDGRVAVQFEGTFVATR